MQPSAFGGLRVTMLLSDSFGGFGGIAKFNRDFLWAINGITDVIRVNVLPRLISDPISATIPEVVVYDRAAASGKLAFMWRLLRRAFYGGPVDLVVCGHLHLLPAAKVLAALRGARTALVVHGIEAWRAPSKPLQRWAARHVDLVLAVSDFSAQRFAAWANIPAERLFVLPNCVDLDRFVVQAKDAALVERHGLQSGKVILTVGRLMSEERYKGFDEIIEIMPRLLERFPTLKYMIVGDGPDRVRLAAKAQAAGVADSVIFAGRISEEEKVAYYSIADVYAMPSSGEGFGIVLIEAAACGIPVIGSNADGSREALLAGVLGQLVDPIDANALVRAITEVLVKSPPRVRIAAVATFDVDSFRRRVALWFEQRVLPAVKSSAR